MTRTKTPSDIVSMVRCLCCGRYVIFATGNHHPWCLPCMYDEFDWGNGHDDITRAEAERIKKEDE